MKMKFKPEYILALLLMAPTVKVQAQTDVAEQENPVILYSGTSKRYEIADIIVTGIEENNHKTLLKLSGLSVG